MNVALSTVSSIFLPQIALLGMRVSASKFPLLMSNPRAKISAASSCFLVPFLLLVLDPPEEAPPEPAAVAECNDDDLSTVPIVG